MLALERSRHEQPYLQHFPMDPAMHDPFASLNTNDYTAIGTYSSIPPTSHAFFDPTLLPVDNQLYNKFDSYQQQAPSASPSGSNFEQLPSTSSSTTGPSAASTSSSAIGSPYQESWIDMNQAPGYGPGTVASDGYQEYVANGMEGDLVFANEKLPNSFVGKCANVSSSGAPQYLEGIATSPPEMKYSVMRSPMTASFWQHVDSANLDKQTSSPSQHSSASGYFTGQSPDSTISLRHTMLSSGRGRSQTHPVSKAGVVKSRHNSNMRPNIKLHSMASSPFPTSSPSQSAQFKNNFFSQSSGIFLPTLEPSYPSLLQPFQQQSNYPPPTISYSEEPHPFLPSPGFGPTSAAGSPTPHNLTLNHQQHAPPTSVPSPYLSQNGFQSRPMSLAGRRSSVSSIRSRRSQHSPLAGTLELDDEVKEKGRCPHPDCGRVFKDLKAHMLTHQSERPEKCPIVTCEYHLKGFARKYDKNRHTLTHYKGTMVCGFCPGSGSAAEKSFNRADVFKRHLTSVHGVEQTAPNCRKKSPPTAANREASGYSPDSTGKCSTCSATFSSAQDFYEHLDDCVLRVVQQEEPSEAINYQRLQEVAADDAVRQTMEKHMLLDSTTDLNNELGDGNDDDENDSSNPSGKSSSKSSSKALTLASSGITKPRPTMSRRRNNRNNYPPSWGCPTNKMKMKKRVLCLYDGQRRLWKDEMMLDNEFEVRLKLPGGDGMGRDSYVTDLDVETLKRARGILHSTDDERGPYLHDPSMAGLIGQTAVPLLGHPQDMNDEVNIEELMS
ncbi:hypothetical protein AJ80_05207 [Polytolypa hystricis UAMH7299]|uniref:C2H2-type domain-containing protein n=1 Tax=Polytolypa hystricis (strain UAMH7299) TaxID=1447883 RepID=A0A2B7Y6X1_POLH7|nr:hypothetical protein AJ80_05207 [Polytolypa hystricis UAMH7299]